VNMGEPPSAKETARQYRLARQTLAMHADLRDQYARMGLAIELFILVFSALIYSTTFAGDDFYKSLHLTPTTGRLVLGTASAVAFIGSLVLLLLNPRGKSATHGAAASKWSEVVLRFRRLKDGNDAWPPEAASELSDAYAQVSGSMVPIPDAKFNHLKSRYLRKVEISRLQERHPGCPITFLALFCRLRDSHGALRDVKNRTTLEKEQTTASATSQPDSPGGRLPHGP